MEFAEKLYIGLSIRKKRERVIERMEQGKMLLSIYCVTKASNPNDLYDIYSYHELRQSYYKEHPVEVLGIAGSWEEAVGLVAHMITKIIH
jgi:hypothetical protein